MKRQILIVLALLTAAPQAFACYRDARICKDGTGRGRDPRHNCEFWPPCPEDGGRTSTQLKEDMKAVAALMAVNPDDQRDGGEE